MKKVVLYEKYHKRSKLQKKIISDNDFTYKNIITSIQPHLIKVKTLLDIGSATGTLSLYFASKGISVDGIELSYNAYRFANLNKKLLRIKNVNFINTSIEKYMSNKKYDLITCFEVLEHLKEDSKILSKIYKMLNKHSVFVLSVPSKDAPLYKLGLLKKFDERVGHLRRYSIDEIENKVNITGFTIINILKTEGVLRNILYTNLYLNWIIRFTKLNIINNLITLLDKFTLNLFGESQIILICKKR